MRLLIISNIKENGYGESTRPYFIGKGLASLDNSVLHVCEKGGRENNRTSFLNKTLFKTPFEAINRWLNFAWLFLRVKVFNPDIIYVHQLNNWTWARLSRALPNTIRVYDAHTSVYFEHKHFGASEKGLKTTFNREKNAVTEASHVVTVSNETRDILTKLYGIDENRITIVKNATQIKALAFPVSPENEKFICTSILPIDGFPSNDMALEMLLEIAAEIERIDPNISFTVIGGGKKPVPRSGNVNYVGFVDDFEDEILKSDICLATYPESAVCGGVRNKLCDFLALGQAIISTKEGMRGFDDSVHNENYVLANTVSEFVAQIVELKKNPEKVKALKSQSLALGHKYQWQNRAVEINSLFKSLLTTQ